MAKDEELLLLLLLGGGGPRVRRPPAAAAPPPSNAWPDFDASTPAPNADVEPGGTPVSEPTQPAAAPAAAAADLGTGRQSRAYQVRWTALARDSLSAQGWLDELRAAAPPQYRGDPEWANGLARWIGIESGGRAGAVSPLGEVGLTQIMPRFAQGWSQADLAAYGSATTPRRRLAELAWKHLAQLDSGGARDATSPNVGARLWRIKMRHGLPACWRELQAQGFLVGGPTPGGALDAAWERYRPGPTVLRYAWDRVPAPRNVLVRFIPPADVVAGYRRDWTP